MKQFYSVKKVNERVETAKVAAASRTPEQKQDAAERMVRVVSLIERTQSHQPQQIHTKTQSAS